MSTIRATYPLSPTTPLEIAQGNLTQEAVDAIVNAANRHLAHGGGVAAAIVRAGGSSIQRESDAWVHKHGPVTNADPAYTLAGKLPARFIIHAVGPRQGEGDEDAKLASAIQGSLRRGDELKLKSIAFPAISTGIFGFPKERAAMVILVAIKDYCDEMPPDYLQKVRMTIIDQPTLDVFHSVWEIIFPVDKGSE